MTRERHDRPRIVVTGLGVVSALGMDIERYWSALLSGTSAIHPIRDFDSSECVSQLSASIENFCTDDWPLLQGRTRLSRAARYAILATDQALRDGGLEAATGTEEQPALYLGTTMCQSPAWDAVNALWLEHEEPPLAAVEALCRDQEARTAVEREYFTSDAAVTAEALGLQAECLVFPAACAAGNMALAAAYERLAQGQVSFALAGGADPLAPITFFGFNRLLSLAPDTCRPFDLERKGVVMGEGAAMLLLETLDHARHRGAPIHAELLGYGLSCDASSMTIPHVDGMTAVIRNTLQHCGVAPEEIDHVNAHGTGTPLNDTYEYQALQRVLGERVQHIPVTANKSMLGHAMGAASALEALASVLTVREGKIPPTMNFHTPDPECPVDCVPNRMREQKVRTVLNNSFGFGANNCATLFRRWEEA